MLFLQASIGAVNDLADVEFDRVGKPAKPIPAGLVAPSVARDWAVGSLALCIVLAVPSGATTVVVAAACVALGYVYDLRLSRTAWSWLPLALALPLLPVFAWVGAAGDVPSGLLVLVPIAMLAGGTLLVGNGLVDVERDGLAGKATLAVQLGRWRAWLVHAAAFGVAIVAVLALVPGGALTPLRPAVGSPGVDIVASLRALRTFGLPLGALAVAAGVALLGAPRPTVRERGWELEAIGTAAIGVGWFAGMALAGAGE
jgi:geranylgeranylglycerol-phosphate geranylgeranyltransferase